MQRMNKLKKLVKSDKIPLVILFFVMLILTLSKQFIRDDLYFSDFANITGIARLLWFMEWRFWNWTSRNIIELVLILFVRDYWWLWKIAEPVIYVLLAFGIYRVFVRKNENRKIMYSIIVSLILLIPQIMLGTAGWTATSLNYLWPTTFGILCLIPIRKCIDGGKVKFFEIPIYLGMLMFAENVEQVAIVLATIYILFTIYLIAKKKINPLIIVMLLISILNIVYILKSPGNANRTESEIKMHFVDYKMLNIIDKTAIGIGALLQEFIIRFHPIYTVFTILLAIQIWKKHTSIFYKVIAIFPIFMGIAFNVGGNITYLILEKLRIAFLLFGEEEAILIHFGNFDQIVTYLPFFLSIMNIGCLILSVYIAFGHTQKSMIAFLTISAGLCSKFIMGFVVSVFVSGVRSQFLMIICMIIVSILLLDGKKQTELKTISNVLIISAVFMVINNWCVCLTFR